MDYLIPKMLLDLENQIDKKDIRYYYFGLPTVISDDVALQGAICIKPVKTEVRKASTGLLDRTTHTLQLIVVKSAKIGFNKSYNNDNGIAFMTRIIEGRNSSNELGVNSIRYILRQNLKEYGILQPSISIDWDDDRFRKDGVTTSTMTIVIEDIDDQRIN